MSDKQQALIDDLTHDWKELKRIGREAHRMGNSIKALRMDRISNALKLKIDQLIKEAQ